jgi:uncharacterized protein
MTTQRMTTDADERTRSAGLATGIGLRFRHHEEVVAAPSAAGFLEVHSENYMGGGPARRALERIRRDHALSLHGVGLSLGTAEGISARHLERLAELVEALEPALVSEHLAWSIAGGVYLNDLLPLVYTEESLAVVARHVAQMQERLRRRVLIENPSTYLRFADSVIPEVEFLAEVAKRSGCGILCDVNNIVVTTTNHGGDPIGFLDALPPRAVGEIHLAGYHRAEADGVTILIDDHGSHVRPEVWALFEAAVARFPHAPALIEWDTDPPPLAVLLAEAGEADRRRARVESRHARAA